MNTRKGSPSENWVLSHIRLLRLWPIPWIASGSCLVTIVAPKTSITWKKIKRSLPVASRYFIVSSYSSRIVPCIACIASNNSNDSCLASYLYWYIRCNYAKTLFSHCWDLVLTLNDLWWGNVSLIKVKDGISLKTFEPLYHSVLEWFNLLHLIQTMTPLGIGVSISIQSSVWYRYRQLDLNYLLLKRQKYFLIQRSVGSLDPILYNLMEGLNQPWGRGILLGYGRCSIAKSLIHFIRTHRFQNDHRSP